MVEGMTPFVWIVLYGSVGILAATCTILWEWMH